MGLDDLYSSGVGSKIDPPKMVGDPLVDREGRSVNLEPTRDDIRAARNQRRIVESIDRQIRRAARRGGVKHAMELMALRGQTIGSKMPTSQAITNYDVTQQQDYARAADMKRKGLVAAGMVDARAYKPAEGAGATGDAGTTEPAGKATTSSTAQQSSDAIASQASRAVGGQEEAKRKEAALKGYYGKDAQRKAQGYRTGQDRINAANEMIQREMNDPGSVTDEELKSVGGDRSSFIKRVKQQKDADLLVGEASDALLYGEAGSIEDLQPYIDRAVKLGGDKESFMEALNRAEQQHIKDTGVGFRGGISEKQKADRQRKIELELQRNLLPKEFQDIPESALEDLIESREQQKNLKELERLGAARREKEEMDYLQREREYADKQLAESQARSRDSAAALYNQIEKSKKLKFEGEERALEEIAELSSTYRMDTYGSAQYAPSWDEAAVELSKGPAGQIETSPEADEIFYAMGEKGEKPSTYKIKSTMMALKKGRIKLKPKERLDVVRVYKVMMQQEKEGKGQAILGILKDPRAMYHYEQYKKNIKEFEASAAIRSDINDMNSSFGFR